MTTKTKILVSIVLVFLGITCRLLPHAWNFSPIIGLSLFAGVYLGRKYAVVLPIVAMFLGDVFIGFYDIKLQLAVYFSFILIGLGASLIKKHKSAETILAGSIVGAIIFFLVTNFAVWQFSPWYAQTWAGLMECYYLALPFFRNTLLSSVFYSGVLFGSYEAVSILVRHKKLSFFSLKLKNSYTNK